MKIRVRTGKAGVNKCCTLFCASSPSLLLGWCPTFWSFESNDNANCGLKPNIGSQSACVLAPVRFASCIYQQVCASAVCRVCDQEPCTDNTTSFCHSTGNVVSSHKVKCESLPLHAHTLSHLAECEHSVCTL